MRDTSDKDNYRTLRYATRTCSAIAQVEEEIRGGEPQVCEERVLSKPLYPGR
jgi:hypothetical protein